MIAFALRSQRRQKAKILIFFKFMFKSGVCWWIIGIDLTRKSFSFLLQPHLSIYSFVTHSFLCCFIYLFIILFFYILLIILFIHLLFFSLTWCVIRVPLDLSLPRLCLPAISLVALPWVLSLTSLDARFLSLLADFSAASLTLSRLSPLPSGYLHYSVPSLALRLVRRNIVLKNIVIFKKRGVFHYGFQTRKKRSKDKRLKAECFYCFRVFGNPEENESWRVSFWNDSLSIGAYFKALVKRTRK